jgi:hypothetical protein
LGAEATKGIDLKTAATRAMTLKDELAGGTRLNTELLEELMSMCTPLQSWIDCLRKDATVPFQHTFLHLGRCIVELAAEALAAAQTDEVFRRTLEGGSLLLSADDAVKVLCKLKTQLGVFTIDKAALLQSITEHLGTYSEQSKTATLVSRLTSFGDSPDIDHMHSVCCAFNDAKTKLNEDDVATFEKIADAWTTSLTMFRETVRGGEPISPFVVFWAELGTVEAVRNKCGGESMKAYVRVFNDVGGNFVEAVNQCTALEHTLATGDVAGQDVVNKKAIMSVESLLEVLGRPVPEGSLRRDFEHGIMDDIIAFARGREGWMHSQVRQASDAMIWRAIMHVQGIARAVAPSAGGMDGGKTWHSSHKAGDDVLEFCKKWSESVKVEEIEQGMKRIDEARLLCIYFGFVWHAPCTWL